ncbi:pyrophosphatase PpaX [Paenibacillus yanchengensis]|uniref:Pyrophosphatase PpaX n=1 Tax=Paenibacillus yanchengensis TaxID=2035833 RepID=A0ABW4YH54_9BACL
MIKTVLFDLDGTILDTNELIIMSFLQVLENNTPEPLTRDHIIPYMGESLVDQLRKLSGRHDVDDLVAAYRKISSERHDQYVRLFPDVKEVIQQLRKHQVQIGIVTTKARLTTIRGLEYTGIADLVDAVVTSDDVEKVKPDAEPVVQALQLLKATPQSAIMVGDSAVDIISARRAGVQAVGVSWSLKGKSLLEQSGANYMIDHMRQLYAIVGLE